MEDANLKLASVASDPLGASGRTILRAILAGEEDAERLAEMSKGLLRNKLPEMRLALEGRVTEHHRFMLKELLEHQQFVEKKIAEVEAEIERRMRPFEAEVKRLDTIPVVDRVTAWSLIAEVGVKMEQFSLRGALGFLGGIMPGQLRKCRQAAERQDAQGERGAPTWLVSSRLGRLAHGEQLSVGAVPAAGGTTRRQASHLGPWRTRCWWRPITS